MVTCANVRCCSVLVVQMGSQVCVCMYVTYMLLHLLSSFLSRAESGSCTEPTSVQHYTC